jgi:hypothetical protein
MRGLIGRKGETLGMGHALNFDGDSGGHLDTRPIVSAIFATRASATSSLVITGEDQQRCQPRLLIYPT